MSANELQVDLKCLCGGAVTARARDAGGSLQCSCGRSVAVPNLSKLRTLAGTDAYVTNPAEAICKAQREGNDPAGDKCLMCGSSAAVFYKCRAICESSHVKHGTGKESGDIPRLMSLLFLPKLIAFLLLWKWNQPREPEVRGHDVEVSLTLPVCERCATTSGSAVPPSVARQLMSKVPLYQKLLEYYPELTLRVDRPR